LAAESYSGEMLDPFPFEKKFKHSLANDLDIPASLSVVRELTSIILSESQAGLNVSRAQVLLREFGQVVGLQMDRPGPSDNINHGWEKFRKNFSETKGSSKCSQPEVPGV
jgi:hypothetical protein